MPDIRRVLLQKKINDVIYYLHPQTQAGIVKYYKSVTSMVDNEPVTSQVETDVATELATLATSIVNASAAASAEVQALEAKIFGLADGETINAKFDTLKEIADWLTTTGNTSAATIVSDISALQTAVGNTQVGTEGQEGYKARSGILGEIQTLQERVTALENIAPTKVEASSTNGNIKIDGTETQVYNDSELRTNLGTASTASSGTEGQEGYVPAKAATGLHADVEQNASDIDSLETEVGVDPQGANAGTGLKGRISTLETRLGNPTDAADVNSAFGRIKKIEDIDPTKVEDGQAGDPDGTIRVDGQAMEVYGGDPTIIKQDATHRFVTDTEKSNWNATITYTATAPTAANALANTLYLVDLDGPIA